MNKPLPFIIEKQGKLCLNEDVLKIIEKSKNPRLLLFYGATRQGKSTTLNQIIRGNIDTWKYINKEPFESRTSQQSMTVGCDIFGPIKCSEIKTNHNLEININDDFDTFFCDTEGLFSLNGQSKALIPGILTLLQVCTFSVIMINTVPDKNTISQISAEIQFSKILQQINNEFQPPLVAIYISGYQVDIIKYDDFVSCKEVYESEREQTIDLILQYMNDKYKNLKITRKDFKVIPGGPYEHNFDKEPDHNDLKARLYWDSINEIAKQFIIHAKNKTTSYNAQKLISLIRIVFDIFKDFIDLPDNMDLKDVLIEYITKSFENYSNKEFKKINVEIQKDLKNNYNKYYQMLIDDNSAQNKLNQCIEENKIEIYKTLIPGKITNFMENAILKLRQSIEAQFEREFSNISKIIISNDYISQKINFIVEEIKKANFQEDINMDIVKNYQKIWSIIEQENEGLFKFFKEKKPTSLENLGRNFNNAIEKIVQNLISKKKIWKTFFEEKKNEIKDEINKQYLENFKMVQYQEDFEKIIKKNNVLSEELIAKFNEKYFKNLEKQKKDEIIKWIERTCEIEYNELKKENSKKQKWENIIKNLSKLISERIEHYIINKFSGKFFRNEIDPNLGRADVISNEVLKDLFQYQEFTPERKKEIDIIINNHINSAVNIFNKKRRELPLLDDILLSKEKICNQIADEKIKELLNKFKYIEDKIIFNEDNFYSLLKQNRNVILNIPQNNLEFDNMIHKVSKTKSKEYNNILAPKKPKWSKVKENIKSNLYDISNKFINKVLKNKSFKEDIKYDIKILEKEINSLNLFNGIEEKRHEEIKNLIDKIKKETINQILTQSNNLKNWSEIKNNQISKGKDIMIQKSETNLDTKDLNKIIGILINEVKNYPRFCDLLSNNEHFQEVFNELRIIAEQIGKKYIIRKNKEEQEYKEKLENKIQMKALNKELLEEKKQRIQLQKEIEERKKREEEERRRREEEERRRREEEERRRREDEERRRREEEERRIREDEERRRAQYFPRPNYNGCSIVDALKKIGAESSYNYRCTIAARNGIGGYTGTPNQNTHMLNLLKSGQLLRP